MMMMMMSNVVVWSLSLLHSYTLLESIIINGRRTSTTIIDCDRLCLCQHEEEEVEESSKSEEEEWLWGGGEDAFRLLLCVFVVSNHLPSYLQMTG